jgi:hypothetical protein
MILAIDTAGPWVAVALGAADGASPRTLCRPAALNHNEELACLVERLLAEAGVERPTAIAVDIGPGSFTGTRVGVAFAVGSAQGWRVPVLAASSFEVAASLGPPECAELEVALPVVRESWCRAHMTRDGSGWRETGLVELEAGKMPAGVGDTPLIVPWGAMANAITPAPDWNAAAALWSLAARPGARFDEATAVNVRYVGPSQAERKFDARRSAG